MGGKIGFYVGVSSQEKIHKRQKYLLHNLILPHKENIKPPIC